MPKTKVLSGREVVKILEKFNFVIEKQRGSHIKLKRIRNGVKQVLIIPNHKELDKGTLKGIYNQALKYIDKTELEIYFLG